MDFTLSRILQEMGFFSLCIAGSLAFAGVLALCVFLERSWVFRRSEKASRVFADAAAALIEAQDYVRLAEEAEAVRHSHLAQLLLSGARTWQSASRKPDTLGPVERVRRDLERRVESLVADLRRGLNVLASIGSVAPFVGLLGTVVGIISAFQSIAREGSGGLGAVSSGIAEALVETALGLVVAIPAVLAFNYLSGRVDRLTLALEQARGEFVDHLEGAHGNGAVPTVSIRDDRSEGLDVRAA